MYILIQLVKTEILVKLLVFPYAGTGISSVHEKSLEKEELCQRLKEQLDALEKETASKLAEMDAFNSQLKVHGLSKYLALSFFYFSIQSHKLVAVLPGFQKAFPSFQCEIRITKELGVNNAIKMYLELLLTY